MQEAFKIWIDRLTEGRVQKINNTFDPSFMEIDEKELKFRAPVVVAGEAYLAEAELIIHMTAKTKATMPCAICNEMLDTDLKVENFYHSIELKEIEGAIFDFSSHLREALLIELPTHFECSGGNCPERPNIKPFLRDKKENFPFKDL